MPPRQTLPTLPRTPSPIRKRAQIAGDGLEESLAEGFATPLSSPNLEGFSNSPTQSSYDPVGLSPRIEHFAFSPPQHQPLPTFTTTYHSRHSTETDLDPAPLNGGLGIDDDRGYGDTISLLPDTPRRSSNLMVEDANGVFNFQQAAMPKPSASASVKSVSQDA